MPVYSGTWAMMVGCTSVVSGASHMAGLMEKEGTYNYNNIIVIILNNNLILDSCLVSFNVQVYRHLCM